MFCAECGQELGATKFCTSCGTPNPTHGEPTPPTHQPTDASGRSGGRPTARTWVAIGMGVAIMALIGAGTAALANAITESRAPATAAYEVANPPSPSASSPTRKSRKARASASPRATVTVTRTADPVTIRIAPPGTDPIPDNPTGTRLGCYYDELRTWSYDVSSQSPEGFLCDYLGAISVGDVDFACQHNDTVRNCVEFEDAIDSARWSDVTIDAAVPHPSGGWAVHFTGTTTQAPEDAPKGCKDRTRTDWDLTYRVADQGTYPFSIVEKLDGRKSC